MSEEKRKIVWGTPTSSSISRSLLHWGNADLTRISGQDNSMIVQRGVSGSRRSSQSRAWRLGIVGVWEALVGASRQDGSRLVRFRVRVAVYVIMIMYWWWVLKAKKTTEKVLSAEWEFTQMHMKHSGGRFQGSSSSRRSGWRRRWFREFLDFVASFTLERIKLNPIGNK